MSASRALVLLALATVLGAAPATAVEVVPTGFVVDQVMTWSSGAPFNGQLVSFTMLPDGRFIFVERVADNVDVGYPGLANPVTFGVIPDVSHGGFEEGLLGVIVDPGWPTRPYLYFYYNQISNNCYVTRYTITGDLTSPTSTNLALTDPYFILTDIQDLQDFHQGGTLRFGPDGMLYLGIGDDGNACNAQDPSIPTGSILRMDVSSLPAGPGGPPAKADITPPDNPLSGPGDWERLNWAYGFRNPFRFNIDAVNGDLCIGDVGLNSYEELDVVPYTSPSGNYGWPQREGPIDPMCCGVCGPGPPYVDPVFAYPHGAGAYTAIAGGPYRGLGAPNAFPAEYERNVFCLEFFEGWIRRFVFNGTTWEAAPPVPGQPTADHWAEGFDQMADFQVARDGSLYLLRFVGTTRGVYAIRRDPALGVDVAAAGDAGYAVSAAPNPAGRGESIRFGIRTPGSADLRLLVTDVAGRTVASHVFGGGATDAAWEWNRAGGVPAGVYFYRLEADGRAVAGGKVTTLR